MSVKASREVNSLPYDDRRDILYTNEKSSRAHTRDQRFSTSVSLDTADSGAALDLQPTKAAYHEDQISGKNSLPQKQLRKTFSCGGINVPSKSKVVLRRWASSFNDREENAAKVNSSSALYQGSRGGDRVLFRPVSSILLSTPWEKDFKGHVSKVEADNGRKADDIEKINKRHNTEKESLVNPNSCSINKHEGSELSSPGNEISIPASQSNVDFIKATDERKNSVKESNGIAFVNSYGCNGGTGEPTDREVTARPLTANTEVSESDCKLNKHTTTPNRPDSHNHIDTVFSYQTIDQIENEEASLFNADTSQFALENMPISTGSYYYKSKYGNISTYARRGPETAGRTLSTDKSGKETVAEVDAYISAYKSRRERSFEYGDSVYQSYTQARAERKSSPEKSTQSYQSHATRKFSSGYTNTNIPVSSIALESGRQRPSFSTRKTLEKDYSSSRTSRFLTKTDRSRSFDVEHVGYSSFSRTGSGGRYPRKNISSPTGSSSSASPPERETRDYSTEFMTSKSSILSSDALTPSERTFFSTSKIPGARQRKSSLDNTRLSGLTGITPKQRPLSLIGKLSQTASSSGNDKTLRRSSTISMDYDSDMSSRSRIMGGILSRFFTEEEPPAKELIVSASATVKESESDMPILLPDKKNHASMLPDKKYHEPMLPEDKNNTSMGNNKPEKNNTVVKSDGDSSDVPGSSPVLMSQEGIQPKPKSGQMVRVKSVFVEEGDAEAAGKGSSQKSSQKNKASTVHGSKAFYEARRSIKKRIKYINTANDTNFNSAFEEEDEGSIFDILEM